MTKISDLPVNLVEEILSKVPMKYTRAVRLTCKEWDTLSKSRSFSKMHIDKISAGDESMMVAALVGYNLYLTKVVLVGNYEDPFIECEGKLNKQNNISQVFHCDGLLLCVLKDDYTKVVVWNPYWSQIRSIECRYPLCCQDRRGMFIRYALGYEDKGSSCRTYKFLRFADACQFTWYEIYDFESSSWKTLDVTPHWFIPSHQRGVSIKGNTYWLALARNVEEEEEEDALDNHHIICFDYTSESFGPLLRLPFDAGDDFEFVTLSCVREEKLAVLFTHHGPGSPLEFEIWITTKIEVEKVSWSKFLRVVDAQFYPLISTNCFFIDEEKKVTMSFEEVHYKTFNIVGEDGCLKKLELKECFGRDIDWTTSACSYAPSLANIKQPAA